MLCAEFGCNLPSGLKEEDESVNDLQTDDKRTDKRTTDNMHQLRLANIYIFYHFHTLILIYKELGTLCTRNWPCRKLKN